MSEIKVNLRQCSQGVDVNINQTEQDITASFYSGIMLVHDYTLQGNGTSTTPLGISQEILDRIDDAGKVNDVYVNGVSVLAEDKIAYVVVPTNVSDLNNDLNFQTLTQVSNAISVHNESSTAHADIRQDIADVSDSIATSIATHNTSDSAHQDIRNLISGLSEWTTESYTATTTNFVVGQTYTIDGAFQRMAALFAGAFDEISTINSKIPAQATTQNQLADKAFVNSSIASSAANFRGNWSTWEDVPTNASLYPVDYSGSTIPTNNDYLVVNDASDYVGTVEPLIRVETVSTSSVDAVIKITDVLTADVYEFHHYTTQTITPIGATGFYVRYTTPRWYITADMPFAVDGTAYQVGDSWHWTFGSTVNTTADGYRVYSGAWRFVYSGIWTTEGKNGWYPAYRIGNAFTAAQWAAINSNITGTMVSDYVDPTSNASTAYNKRITALETDKRDIINSANKVYATNSQGGNLDTLEYSQSATASTISQRTADGELIVATPTTASSATTKDYVDTIASTKQNTLTAGTNISIVNDVISSTAQESFFRGRWSDWARVPSVSGDYPADYHGNHTPEQNDYMVVADASDYVAQGEDLWVSNIARQYTTIRTADGSFDVPYGTVIDRKFCNDMIQIVFTSVAIYIYALGPVLYNNTRYDGTPENPIQMYYRYTDNSFGEQHFETVPSAPLSGTWRFGYYGTWSVDGKNGWKAEYQVENTLPDATDSVKGIAKLYNTTGANTDGSMTQASVTTALGTKQDTLTAGTNIDITNNVISATSYESFFRGSFDTWTLVPTDPTLYKVDFHGNTTPLKNDYMVVTDASGYINPDFADDPDNVSIKRNSTAYTIDITVGGTTISVGYTKINQNFRTIRYLFEDAGYEGIGCEWLEVIYYPGAPGQWWVKATGDYYINNVAKNGSVFLMNTNTSVDDVYYLSQDPGVAPLPISGSWRFRYVSVWSQKGKVGWQAEYQVEETLPNASDTEAGIAKLYNTTGANTDGAIDQNGTTTAINTAVSTHNTASNAHSNIRGTANGLATLDANAKVPLAQMNDAVLGNVSYQGLWNAATNDPFLPNPSGELPTGYTQYGWIKTVSGTPYIDTGISYDYANEDEITVETKLNYLRTASAGYYSFGFTSGNGSINIWKTWQGVPIVRVGGLTASIASETDTVVSMKVDKVLGQNSITIDGTTTYGATSSFANLNIYVLSANNGGTPSSNNSYVKFYYVNISKSGTLLARLLPCKRNSDDAVGMYDTVRNTFYPVTGGVAEVGGAIEIPKGHYYITSTAGTQFGIHFEVGDWVISTGTSWTKVDNTDAVSSVEGRTGNVTVINDNASTGATTYTWSADKLTTQFGNLGTAAYTASTDYATAAQGAKADTALQPADVQEYTANEVETLWNSI